MRNLDRRVFLASIPLALAACSAGAQESDRRNPARTDARLQMIVHKSPSCGCCGAWVDHLRANGFEVQVVETDNIGPTARRLGVPDAMRGCHTGEIAGYAIEGHVPATDIRRLLAERPVAAGLAVPGMPMGAPGMDANGAHESYAVLLFDRDGRSREFARY